MPNYLYVATANSGKSITGKIDAQDRSSALQLINEQGLRPIILKEGSAKRDNFSLGDFFGKNRVKADDLVMFTRQLSAMVSAGVPIIRALGSLPGKHVLYRD